MFDPSSKKGWQGREGEKLFVPYIAIIILPIPTGAIQSLYTLCNTNYT